MLWICCRGCRPLLKASPGLHQQQRSGGSWRGALRDAPCLARQTAQRQRYRNTSCSPRSLWMGDPGRVGWLKEFRNVMLCPAKKCQQPEWGGGGSQRNTFPLKREKSNFPSTPLLHPMLVKLCSLCQVLLLPKPSAKKIWFFLLHWHYPHGHFNAIIRGEEEASEPHQVRAVPGAVPCRQHGCYPCSHYIRVQLPTSVCVRLL